MLGRLNTRVGGRNRVPVVTPVPNFLFSEQKLNMLPQGGACAMFFLQETTIPVAAKFVEIG